MVNNTNGGMISMSMRELDRLKVIEAVVEGQLMPWRAVKSNGWPIGIAAKAQPALYRASEASEAIISCQPDWRRER